MDRRAKKLEKKRKSRELAKKNARLLAARKPSEEELLTRSASRRQFGPCFLSAGWDEPQTPGGLVHVVVTRELEPGLYLPAVVLLDRELEGVKDAFVHDPTTETELRALVNRISDAHGGIDVCSAGVAQSVVFSAIDKARTFGFEPHPDFPEALVGPRPPELADLSWAVPGESCIAPPRRADMELPNSQELA
jgi:hypothetical protein